MKLAARPEPRAAINDVVVHVHASGFGLRALFHPRFGLVAGPSNQSIKGHAKSQALRIGAGVLDRSRAMVDPSVKRP